jgi:hypothetical protein
VSPSSCEECSIVTHDERTRPSNQLGCRRHSSVSSSNSGSTPQPFTGLLGWDGNVPGTEVIRRLLVEETSTLTLAPARGERRVSLKDCTVRFRRRPAGTSEAARVLKRGASFDQVRRLRAQELLSGESNRLTHPSRAPTTARSRVHGLDHHVHGETGIRGSKPAACEPTQPRAWK